MLDERSSARRQLGSLRAALSIDGAQVIQRDENRLCHGWAMGANGYLCLWLVY